MPLSSESELVCSGNILGCIFKWCIIFSLWWQRVIMMTISVNTGVDLLLRQMTGVTIAFRILAEVFKNMDPAKHHSTVQRKENNYQ